MPFSETTDTGNKILMRGMELNVLPVLLHRMNLDCDLVQGEVSIGVRPALPVEGVDMILGNNLAGSRVWANVPPPPVVNPSPSVSEQPDESTVHFPEVFPGCAVTFSLRGQMRRLRLLCHVCLIFLCRFLTVSFGVNRELTRPWRNCLGLCCQPVTGKTLPVATSFRMVF